MTINQQNISYLRLKKLLLNYKNNKSTLSSTMVWLKQECRNKYALGYNRGFLKAVKIKNSEKVKK